jgi:4-amino-4-deoxychorismate lyase
MSEAFGTLIDGVEGTTVPIDDRGLQYGDGVFETLLLRRGHPRFLEAHLARLRLGCTRLGIHFAAMAELRAEVARFAAIAPSLAILKIIVTRGSATQRGYAPRGDAPPRRIVSLGPAPAPRTDFASGLQLQIAKLRLGENPALAGIKHLNRLENVLAAAELTGSASFDALLLDAGGSIICGSMSNVFVVREGAVATPLLDRCGVAGVMRGIVLRECHTLGIDITQERLSLSDLKAADEVFVTNARIGVVPVRRVGEHSFGMNRLALKLRAHIETLDA